MGFGMFLDVLDVGCRLESLGMGWEGGPHRTTTPLDCIYYIRIQ